MVPKNEFGLLVTAAVVLLCRSATLQESECAEDIQKNGMDFLNKGIQMIDPRIKIAGRFHNALKDMYKNVNRQHIINVTNSNLLGKKTSDFFNNKSISLFEVRYIYLYTTDTVYKEMNRIMREHDCTSKSLLSDEYRNAPVGAVLMSVLMYWSALTDFTGTLYRGLNLSESDINEYHQNKIFVWNQFVSTSKRDLSYKDSNVTFIIKADRHNTNLGPKPIEMYAFNRSLEEVLFPPGVTFQVVKVVKKIKDSIGIANITIKTYVVDKATTSLLQNSFLETITILLCFHHLWNSQ